MIATVLDERFLNDTLLCTNQSRDVINPSQIIQDRTAHSRGDIGGKLNPPFPVERTDAIEHTIESTGDEFFSLNALRKFWQQRRTDKINSRRHLIPNSCQCFSTR